MNFIGKDGGRLVGFVLAVFLGLSVFYGGAMANEPDAPANSDATSQQEPNIAAREYILNSLYFWAQKNISVQFSWPKQKYSECFNRVNYKISCSSEAAITRRDWVELTAAAKVKINSNLPFTCHYYVKWNDKVDGHSFDKKIRKRNVWVQFSDPHERVNSNAWLKGEAQMSCKLPLKNISRVVGLSQEKILASLPPTARGAENISWFTPKTYKNSLIVDIPGMGNFTSKLSNEEWISFKKAFSPKSIVTTGALVAKGEPVGAKAKITGLGKKSMIKTLPFTLENLRLGLYTLSFSANGYMPQEYSVYIEPGVSNSIDVSLQKQSDTGEQASGAEDKQNLPPDTPIKISAGNNNACALFAGGTVKCWGNETWVGDGVNRLKPLGDQRPIKPVTVALGEKAIDIAAGSSSSCAVTKSGKVKCWGSNFEGALGDGGKAGKYSNMPVLVSGLKEKVTSIASGELNRCAVGVSGRVFCWGSNSGSACGQAYVSGGTKKASMVAGANNAVSVLIGEEHGCHHTRIGQIYCWGKCSRGQCGNESYYKANKYKSSLVPMLTEGIEKNIKSISSRYRHSCALLDNGKIKCWGWNEYGQLGNGQMGKGNESALPIYVEGLPDATIDVSVGYKHTCAVMANGDAYCWGANYSGECGTGRKSPGEIARPAKVTITNEKIRDISCGRNLTCAITESRKVLCWGENRDGQCGNSEKSYVIEQAVEVKF